MTSAGISSLYGDADMAKVMFGQRAVHMPCWMYVQHQGEQDGKSIVALAGASSMTAERHPALQGSRRAHLFVVGDMILRPRIAVATDALQGYGLGSFYTHDHGLREMLTDGEVLFGAHLTDSVWKD